MTHAADADDAHAGEELLELLRYVLVAVNALLFVAAVVVFATSPRRAASDTNAGTNGAAAAADTSSASAGTKHALLVTAHPDDESMFFLPLVHSLTQQQQQQQRPANGDVHAPEWRVHLLCLSRGNFDGLGAVREQEMVACGEFLGIDKRDIHVLEDPELQDGMQAQWSHAHIAKIVLESMEAHRINAVFTFDDYGVSGHANHIAVHFGVKQAVEEQHKRCAIASASATSARNTSDEKAPLRVKGWALESTSILRKYIGVLDALVSSWTLSTSDAGAFVFLGKPWWNYQAMALHRSQFVWYRRLFVLFSRYTFVNTFQPLGASESESPGSQAQEEKKTQ